MRIRDVDAYQQISEYIRKNPVARHLVSEANEFPHSSAHTGFELDPPPQGLKPMRYIAADGMARAMP